MPVLFQRELVKHRADMRDLLERLVHAPLEAAPGEEVTSVVDTLCDALRGLGAAPTLLSVPPVGPGPSHPTIVATFGDGPETVYLHGRYRALPASHPRQFRPWWQAETLYGRGTADMTGGLVSMLFAVRAILDTEALLVGRIVLVFVPGDDEAAARAATAQLVRLGVIGSGGVGMYTPQPTGGVIWNASRGVIALEVRVRGSAPDAPATNRGSAFAAATEIAQSLFDLRHRIARRKTDFFIRPPTAGASMLVIGGNVDGGVKFEATSSECVFSVERRMNPEEDFDVERAELMAVFDEARQRGLDCEVRVVEEGRPSGTSSRSTAAVALERAVCKVRERLPGFLLYPGLLDHQFYAQVGVPAAAYGPGHAAATKGDREFVKMDAVIEHAAIYAMTAIHHVGDPAANPAVFL